jgi:hypothetical protein
MQRTTRCSYFFPFICASPFLRPYPPPPPLLVKQADVHPALDEGPKALSPIPVVQQGATELPLYLLLVFCVVLPDRSPPRDVAHHPLPHVLNKL